MSDLVGGWKLDGWSLVYDDGRPDEYPLGQDAAGLILYTPDGHVSATLMRRPDGDHSNSLSLQSFAYAGRYDVRDGAVFHSIEVSTNAALVGATSMRRISLEGDRLTLSGPDFTSDSRRTQLIRWRRAP
ncbi:MAG: lipocalin-like domain-containing protein [Proteobacteria bacterium]|nr:lipocalin-like domain-containing protein [Pseudomonadota bacterium]